MSYRPALAKSAKKYRLLLGTEVIGSVAIAALLLSASVTAGSTELTSAEALQREWLNVQSGKNHDIRKTWWKNLDLESLKAYLVAGADVNASNKRRWTPLHSAARFNSNLEILVALLEAGAVVNAKDKAGDTPLHWAAAQNPNVEVIIALIESGADVNDRDKFGWTPLHTAAESSSRAEIIEVLLGAGAKPKKRAYFLLFRPTFLLKHNKNMADFDKKKAMALLQQSKR